MAPDQWLKTSCHRTFTKAVAVTTIHLAPAGMVRDPPDDETLMALGVVSVQVVLKKLALRLSLGLQETPVQVRTPVLPPFPPTSTIEAVTPSGFANAGLQVCPG